MADDGLRIEYVEARRVLLDVLTALSPHVDALVLVGAQAVYLRTIGRIETYQAFTTDADLVLDPRLLGPIPPLGHAMETAGFTLTDEPGIWEAHVTRPGFDGDITVPVDLIVPRQLASTAGRRSARLPGDHGKSTARKSAGLEGTVVDNSPIELASLEDTDTRRITVNVAGLGALFVAKLHKIGDRLQTPDRLLAKDAGDVYRLFDAISPSDMATTLQTLLADDRSAATTTKALGYLEQLFVTPASTGTRLAVEALRTVLPEETVSAAVIAYVTELRRIGGT